MTISLEDALDRLITCATAAPCPREEACFAVAMWAREQYARTEPPADEPPPTRMEVLE